MKILLCILCLSLQAWSQGAATHAAKAARLMEDRLFGDAGAEFEQAIAADPSNNALRLQYATCLFAQGHNAEARQQFEEVKNRLGDSPAVNYYLGRLDLLDNNYSAAIQKLRPLASSPDFPQAAFYLGLAYLGTGAALEGTKYLEQAARRNPHEAEVHYRLARAYSQSGREADAAKEYESYRQSRAEFRATEQVVRACNEDLHNRPLPEARGTCQRVADPNDPERLIVLGQLYGENGAFAEAIEPLQQAATLDPNSFEAWHNLGLSLFRLKRYADARRPLERAAELNPSFFDTLNLLAATLYVLGDDAAALPVLEKAHALKPDDAQITAALEQLRAARKGKP